MLVSEYKIHLQILSNRIIGKISILVKIVLNYSNLKFQETPKECRKHFDFELRNKIICEWIPCVLLCDKLKHDIVATNIVLKSYLSVILLTVLRFFSETKSA